MNAVVIQFATSTGRTRDEIQNLHTSIQRKSGFLHAVRRVRVPPVTAGCCFDGSGMSPYEKLLRDPRWQRRRSEVYTSALWTCVICGRKDRTLTVHHVVYVKGRQPWEYRDELLQCLCEECHKEREAILRSITDAIKIALRDFPTERLRKCSQRIFADAMEAL